jgi:hypothetical protein
VLALGALALGAPSPARADELDAEGLADRLGQARRSAHAALEDVDADTDQDILAPLRRDAATLDGARVRAGRETFDVDPHASDDVAGIDRETSTTARRERLARLERRLGALEQEARSAAERAARGAPGAPLGPGENQLRPETPRPDGTPGTPSARDALSKVLDQPRYKKRTDAQGYDVSGKLDSFEQRLTNWWLRFMQPSPATPTPPWLAAIGAFLAALLPATALGWAVVLVVLVLLAAIVVYLRRRKNRASRDEMPSVLEGGLDGAGARAAAPAEESLSEDHWRREARLLARQGNLRGAVRALYTGVLLFLQRAGRLKFDKGKTNWEHVRELRRNDRELARRLEPLTRTFDLVWYGQQPIPEQTFESFLADSDSFIASSGADGAPSGSESPGART